MVPGRNLVMPQGGLHMPEPSSGWVDHYPYLCLHRRQLTACCGKGTWKTWISAQNSGRNKPLGLVWQSQGHWGFSFFLSFFSFNFYWSRVDLQCCVNFRCTAKWISHTYTHSFLDSFPIKAITEYWVEFPVLYNRFLLVRHWGFSSDSKYFCLSPPFC